MRRECRYGEIRRNRTNNCWVFFKVASVLVFVSCCLGQDRRGGVDSREKGQLILSVLHEGNVSGSLEYWGQCSEQMSHPDFPKIRTLSNYSGQPDEVLQEMFVDDPYMRVTQEPGGMIRMAEVDVPSDLLDVKISHLSFNPIVLKPAPESAQAPGSLHTALHWPGRTPEAPSLRIGPASITLGGPGMALEFIRNAPEVSSFTRAHNIRPFSTDGWAVPGNSGSEPAVVGELDNVTLSQALDYVLKTFPGFWVYENCLRSDGSRTVFFYFY